VKEYNDVKGQAPLCMTRACEELMIE
jgi:hypothetical protein